MQQLEILDGGGGASICDLLLRAIPISIPTKITKISVTVHMMDIWVIMSTMMKTGVLRRTEKHDLQSYLEFMIRIEASSWRELAEADLIDKNTKPYNLPTEEMERLYLSNGGFKPPVPFLLCAKCVHNLIDEPAKNKSVVRDNKRVQLQWEMNSTTVANFLQGKGVSLKDKKGNPTTKVLIFRGATYVPLLAAMHVTHCGGGISASTVVLTKLLASSMKRANALFVIVIARLCVPKSELILLISLSFDSVLVCLIRIHLSVRSSKRRIISILIVQKVYNQKRKQLQMRAT